MHKTLWEYRKSAVTPPELLAARLEIQQFPARQDDKDYLAKG